MTMSKKCEYCQKVFYKKVNNSKKRWEKARFCSQKCAGLDWVGSPAPKTAFKKGQIPWNKGKHRSDATKLKLSIACKGRILTEEHKKKIGDSHRGKKAYQWKGGVSKTKEYSAIYKRRYRARKRKAQGFHTTKEWENLKKKVDYTCLDCGKREPKIKLTVDHIQPLSKSGSDYIWNIQPLCQSCNSKKHDKNTNFLLKVKLLK